MGTIKNKTYKYKICYIDLFDFIYISNIYILLFYIFFLNKSHHLIVKPTKHYFNKKELYDFVYPIYLLFSIYFHKVILRISFFMISSQIHKPKLSEKILIEDSYKLLLLLLLVTFALQKYYEYIKQSKRYRITLQ